MPGTVRVVLRSCVVPDDATITVSTSADSWVLDQPCLWQATSCQWVADVQLDDPAGDLELKFKRDGVWQSGLNAHVEASQLGRPQFFGDLEVAFLDRRWPVVDAPSPGRHIFDPTRGRLEDPDVIVVGSGVGGGIVAYALAALQRADRPLRVLVLEAGSYLFPTHVGNLPRREPRQVEESQQPWQLWPDYRMDLPVELVDLATPDPAPEISRAFNLGGRSLFWGCLAPRAQAWELSTWPEPVAAAIRTYYRRAEILMRVKPLQSSPYERRAVRALKTAAKDPATRATLGAFTHGPAPIAAELKARIPSMIPAGMFSTAELLIERKLADGGRAFPNIDVLLNQEVLSLECTGPSGDREATGVTTRDRTSGNVRTFRTVQGGAVILSAGATCSPLIAQASNLVPPVSAPLVGTGLTDHAIWVQPFTVSPPTTGTESWFEAKDAAVILSRPTREASTTYPFNVKIALNTHRTLARVVNPGDQLKPEMPGEIVFLLDSPLIDGNRVTGVPSQPAVTVTEVATPPEQILEKIRETTTAMLGVFEGATAGDGFVASFGGVGHEVGTMRMDTRSSPGVVDANLLVHGTRNVHVCDLSIFPTSTAANPSLTLAALALRLADHLGQTLQ